MARFEGVHVAIITPFTSDTREVDYKKLDDHVNWLIEKGVHGLVPCGTCGEYAQLSDEERGKVVETVVVAAAGRVPVVVGVAAPTTERAVFWARQAKQVGASGIMALPPISYKPKWAEVVAYYEALSDVGLPVVIYNNTHDNATDLTPDLLHKLESIENIVAVKEFSGDIRRIAEIQEKTNLEVLAGADDLALEGLLAGAFGWIAGLANAVPEESVKLFELVRDGKFEEASALYRTILPLMRWDSTPRLVQAIKYAMELAGRPVGETRAPRLPLDDEDRKAVEQAFYRAHVTV
ncbi:dihydrodipicolinate synthase family protein [Alicyclobacillus fastidiosus]|uniref:Dihydrodipicolinate synthase family protein n=1 Tax=Alicyclobacillus fastidiosus TaxID=392011 RepID=A0ABY6ZEC3_9BACL|nr:dihydrodipicolinate synthase family protein [Alicyclobacillus fastidiosus]WAH40490.1 dihydrodipicolinate synthase family protein [Alicyclobacillus fastidiosus]GMA61905.1 dihydrodipicolinate synthase family protein [Alicyclobacillus fastidiosus]